MNAERPLNTHTHSPAWQPVCQLFRQHLDAFVREHATARFPQKHLIGAAMWRWMINQAFVASDLAAEAEKIHYRPGKEKTGLPLWRLAFKATVRNTEAIDRLFEGKRMGPTPHYARLQAEGLNLKRESIDQEQDASIVPYTPVARYAAEHEWVADPAGAEWLYVYSTRREITNFQLHGITPLVKIGSTRNHYTSRIAAQAGSTAAGTTLVCLHAYQVVDARAAESALHATLKLQGKHVKDAPGSEWFEAAPDTIHALFQVLAGRELR